jgi:ABC-type oligopeptide transport system substrate-binding subunit
MKMKKFAILGVTALTAIISACTASVTTNTPNTANTNKPVVANTNTSNSTTPANSANSTSTNATNTATAPATDGQVIKIDEAGIQMTVPKGFKFSKDGEDTVVKTEDEGVEVRFTVPKDGDYDKAVSAAATELDSYLDDVKITKNGEKMTIDGMEATSIHGTAKDADKEDVEFDLTVIKAPKKPVLATIYAEKASMEKEGANVQKFLQSVKKQ